MSSCVLILEKDAGVRTLLEAVLKLHGFRPLAAGKPEEADVILSEDPVFADLGVPVVWFEKPLRFDKLIRDIKLAVRRR